jgi:hypothetical protein
MYGVWQTGRHYSTPGLQPRASSESLSKLQKWAEANIPRLGSKRLFFAEKIGSEGDLTNADWIVTGLLYKSGIRVSRINPEVYTNVRLGNGQWSLPDSYPEPTEVDWARPTVNIDAEDQKPPATEAVERTDATSFHGAGLEIAPGVVTVEEIPTAAVDAEYSEVQKLISGPVVYTEAQLSARFERYLCEQGDDVIRYRITYPGLPPLYSDLADATANVLYEAKGSAARMSVRLAIGELLDYGRRVSGTFMAVLLPEAPTNDLIDLLKDHEIGCVVEIGLNFTDMTGLKRCP